MSSEHMEVKRKIKNISDIRTFDGLLENAMLPEEQKKMLNMIYVQKKSLDFIADEMNVSIQTIKLWHKKALKKIASII